MDEKMNEHEEKEMKVDYSLAAGQREVVGQRDAAEHDEDADTGYTYENSAEAMAGSIFEDPSQGKKGGKHREKKPGKKLSDKARRIIAVVLLVCICAGAGFGGAVIAVNTLYKPSESISRIEIDSEDAKGFNVASVIAKKAMPSVVGISTVSQTYTQTIFGLQQGTVQGIGTGFIVSEDGYIITNSHVVDDGNSSSITVDLYDGKEYTGTVLWNDSTLDLAVVKIDAKGLVAAEIGDSDSVEIGDYAVAIGNPLGLEFERSVTQGIISGLNRTITTSDGSEKTNRMEGLMQTDASINSGNSGGPLLDSSGRVIGINTAKASSAEGLGFAIPINTVVPIIDELKDAGTYEQTYIGISGSDLSTVIQNYETDFVAKEGVFVAQIYTNSPAAKAGIVENDIITEINGKKIANMTDLKKNLVKFRPGDKIKVTVERNKKSKTIEVTLAAASEMSNTSLKKSEPKANQGAPGGGDGEGEAPGNNGTIEIPYGLSPEDLFGGLFGN